MKTKSIIRLISIALLLILCISCFTVPAYAYEKIVDPFTIERLQEASPDEILTIVVQRFQVENEKLEAMPSWPDLGAARKEFSAFVTEQNNLLIEKMKQVADFEIRYVDRSVGWIHIDIAAKDVEKLKSIEEISDIRIYTNVEYEPLNPSMPEPKRIVGDADMDDELTVIDATHIQRYMAGLIDESEIDLTTSDYDQDGDVTILDATAIQRTLAGLTTKA